MSQPQQAIDSPQPLGNLEPAVSQPENSSALSNSDQFLRETAAPLAKRWMQECIGSHESCRKEVRASTIFCTDNAHLIVDLEGGPSRLLMFSPGNDLTALLDGSVHLVESDSVKPSIQYVALSHRWGKNDLFKT